MIKSENVEAMYRAILKFVEQSAESKAEIISFMMFITKIFSGGSPLPLGGGRSRVSSLSFNNFQIS